jgi:transcriptional regulator with XRE-family HTH domain
MDTKAIRKQIGHRIKVRRVELNLNQGELGEKIGLTQSEVSALEAGRRILRIEHTVVIAAALETTVAYLVGEVPYAS